MCVIMLASNKRLTEEMVGRAFTANSEGAGVAWRQDGKVFWEKGLDIDKMQEKCAELELPYVAHFRISTCGGNTPLLCHPFPIMKDVPLDLKGSTTGYVLFHNGHWTRWKDLTLEGAFKRGNKIPPGVWSDTRAMALAAHNLGLGALNFIGEKAIAFGPNTIEIFEGPSFTEDDGVWCSNMSWKTRFYRKVGSDDDDTHEYCGDMGGYYGVNRPSIYCKYVNCTQVRPAGYDHCIKHLTTDEAKKWTEELDAKNIETNGDKEHPILLPGITPRNGKATGALVGGVPVSELPFREGEVSIRVHELGKQEAVEEGNKKGKSQIAKTGEALVIDMAIDPDDEINFVRRLNPTTRGYKGHTPIGGDVRAQRFIDTRNGIIRVGPM
jgi:NADH:ubiquinone oxidoreductase subunit